MPEQPSRLKIGARFLFNFVIAPILFMVVVSVGAYGLKSLGLIG